MEWKGRDGMEGKGREGMEWKERRRRVGSEGGREGRN